MSKQKTFHCPCCREIIEQPAIRTYFQERYRKQHTPISPNDSQENPEFISLWNTRNILTNLLIFDMVRQVKRYWLRKEYNNYRLNQQQNIYMDAYRKHIPIAYKTMVSKQTSKAKHSDHPIWKDNTPQIEYRQRTAQLKTDILLQETTALLIKNRRKLINILKSLLLKKQKQEMKIKKQTDVIIKQLQVIKEKEQTRLALIDARRLKRKQYAVSSL